jgi:hypothetical protein
MVMDDPPLTVAWRAAFVDGPDGQAVTLDGNFQATNEGDFRDGLVQSVTGTIGHGVASRQTGVAICPAAICRFRR